MFLKSILKIFLNEHFILALVAINSILIFVQEFDPDVTSFEFVESIFTFLFIIEFVVKVRYYGFKTYIRSGWNKMDAILLFISLPSLLMLCFPSVAINTSAFLALRALRVFKFFKVLKFLPNMQGFVLSFRNALKASRIVFLGFVVLMFIVSIFNCVLFKSLSPEYFANPLVSLYSTFRLFSIEGWYEIPDQIAQNSSFWGVVLIKSYFVLLLFCGGIIGMSMVNSIFVDAMVGDNNDELLAKVDALSKQIDRLERHVIDKNEYWEK